MAELLVEGSDLVLALSPAERVWSLRREVRAPLSAVRRVRVAASPWLTMRGWRSTGVAVPGWVALGKRRHGDGWDFSAVRRSSPAVVIELNAHEFGELTVSVDDAPAVGRRLAEAAGIGFDPTPDRGPLG